MAFTPSTFKSNISSNGGGARPSLYKVEINYGTAQSGMFSFDSDQALLVKAANFPASNIAPLAVNYAGRAYKWGGFRTYDNWTVTVINDEDFGARNKMMKWMRYLSGQLDGLRDGTHGDPSATGGTWYDGTGSVQQVSTGGGVIGPKYEFANLWPTELGEIAVDWSSDALQEYTIGFAYDHWTSS